MFRCSACRPSPQFCTIVVRPHRRTKRRDVWPRRSAKRSPQLDSNLPTYFGGTPARLHDEILGVNRITATLFTIFGVVAFVLSAVGLYGVMSFSVNQRTQEFGIRMALGADARRIFRMVMTQGAWQLGIGLVLGVGAAALLLGVLAAAALQNILFKVNALDPFIYFAVAAVLTASPPRPVSSRPVARPASIRSSRFELNKSGRAKGSFETNSECNFVSTKNPHHIRL